MSKYIGTTETYDPCFVPDWDKRLLDVNIIISKELTDDMIQKLVDNKDKIVFHHTITGFGGTQIEPGVNPWEFEVSQAMKLLESGFPFSHYVLRLDPIIPFTANYLVRSLSVLEGFKKELKSRGISEKLKVRVSIIDIYPHVRRIFSDMGLEIPWSGFHAPKDTFQLVELALIQRYSNCMEFYSCAETQFSDCIKKVGCISLMDVELCDPENACEYELPKAPQRSTCLCLMKKQILGVKPGRCPHRCLYCYWKS